MQELCLSVLFRFMHTSTCFLLQEAMTQILFVDLLFLLKIALLIVTPTSLDYQISLQPYKITVNM